jgi:hypothetical protein
MNSPSPTLHHPEALRDPLIFAYTRAEALADGVQVDVSKLAAEAGFKLPVFLTQGVHAEYVRLRDGLTGQDEIGRLWDILTMLHHAIRNAQAGTRRLEFSLYIRNSDADGAKLVTLAAECGAKDLNDPSPALTVMLPDED